MWSILPRWLSSIDRRFTGGYIGPLISGVGNYLMNEKHPVVMVSDLSNLRLYVCNGRGLTGVVCRHSTSLLFRGDSTCLSKMAGNTSHQLTSFPPPLPSPVSATDLTLFRIFVPIVGILPYITMYQAANSDPGFVTPENHDCALRAYPYDHVNFRPGAICRTCHLRKPARSKHCSICCTLQIITFSFLTLFRQTLYSQARPSLCIYPLSNCRLIANGW